MKSGDEYLERLERDSSEAPHLFKEMLIGVTSFFRDPNAFDAVAEQVVPGLLAGKAANDRVRLWVVGCATGEEVYSLAILLSEQLISPDAPKGPGLRDGPRRTESPGGAPGHLPGGHSADRLRPAAGALLRRPGRRLPGEPRAAADVHLLEAQPAARSALSGTRSDLLPKPAIASSRTRSRSWASPRATWRASSRAPSWRRSFSTTTCSSNDSPPLPRRCSACGRATSAGP